MAMAQRLFLATVLLLVSWGLHCSSLLPACPEPCTCQRVPLLNCSSSGLSLVPQHIQDSVTEVDLSHNLLDSATLDRPHHNLRNLWFGNNSITRLSLCIKRNPGGRNVRGRHLRGLRPRSRGGCVSWAPALQLLSVERNQLEQLPEGLEGSELLQVLQLSFNRISTLRPEDLSHLRQLKELHLQHNLITSLHPQMFQDFSQLQVLDLSFNMLTRLHPVVYLSLRNIGTDVMLEGNRWQCDCSMRSLRRRMAYDSSRGLQAWSLMCATPSIVSGRDLLHVEEEDLNCCSSEKPQLHQDVTVYSGSEILLSCSTQDSMWWTPSGQASVSQPQAGLLINDIKERDTGLYVCVSEEQEVVSVFNLQISKIGSGRRKTRSLSKTSQQIIPQGTPNTLGQERNQREIQQSDLTLAVCLSVLITFLIAFILGVLARPCIDIIWRRVINKRRSPQTNFAPSEEQGQYDNEAYSNVDEQEEIGTHRERRVTFSNADRENSNVQYYDTVASGNPENIYDTTMTEHEIAKAEKDTNTSGDSGSENSLRQSSPEENQKYDRDLPSVTDAGRTHNMEFEHIPDPAELEKRRSLSSSSDSSLYDKVFNEDQITQRDHTTTKTPWLAVDSVQQKANSLTTQQEEPQISMEATEIPGFSSEPFADWSPHTKNPNISDPDLWQENEEQFEYSDSVRSMSPKSSSVTGSFNDSKLIVPTISNQQRRDDMSSSSSSVSGEEPTEFTVNREHIERSHNKPEDSLQLQIHRVDLPVRSKHSFSSNSSDTSEENYAVKQKTDKGERIGTEEMDTRKEVKPMPRTKFRVPSLGVTSHSKSLDTRAPSIPAAFSSSSSSESEVEITDLKAKQNTGRVNERITINEPKSNPQNKRHLDQNASSTASNSTSSDESTDDKTKHTKKQEQGDMNTAGLPIKKYQSLSPEAVKPQWPLPNSGHVTPSKRPVDIRAPSPHTDSSSSVDSADETMYQKQKYGETHRDDSDTRWPARDLEHIPHTTSSIDKASAPASESSSSSESEDETKGQLKKQEKDETQMGRLPINVSQTVSHDPQTQRPVLDLGHTTQVKRGQDIKAPSPASDSSSSSDSESETTDHIKAKEKGETHMTRLPTEVSQTVGRDPQMQRPVPDTHVKRGLDNKAPSAASESSSSSDSEDETAHSKKKKRPGLVGTAMVPFQKSPPVIHGLETGWPALDLEHIPRVKRRLAIKAPSHHSDSSSSSDSEDEKTQQTGNPLKVDIAKLASQKSQVNHIPDIRWPAQDLNHVPHARRHPDIKAPSPESDSSSSSDSADETTGHKGKQRPSKGDGPGLLFKKSQTASYDPDTGWPAVDLEQNMHIKKRLDIKILSPASDSSSSSDSESETTNHKRAQQEGETHMTRLPTEVSRTVGCDPQTQRPVADTHVKSGLDIREPSTASESSSSSDSEDETAHSKKKERPGLVGIAGVPFQKSPQVIHGQETGWPALDLEHIPHVKRRLFFKAPSHHSDSSSSSDSENETTNHIRKQEKEEIHIARLPIEVPQTVSHDPQMQRPVRDLGHITHVKKGHDIKAPSLASDSSSSSESEDEMTGHIERQGPGKLNTAGLPFQQSQAKSEDPETRWPAVDLEQKMHIRRRLDIKASSPASESSSSSDSDKTAHHSDIPGKMDIAKSASQKSQSSHHPDKRWPALDLEHIPCTKSNLDKKAPSPVSDSSSSSDSESETIGHIEKQRPVKVDTAGPPFQEFQTKNQDPDTRWPALDLEQNMHIKRRLDIKTLSPASDSSASSDSENEITNHRRKQEKGETHMAWLPIEVSQTVSHNSQTQRPTLDTSIKSGLENKATSVAFKSSSSSDSEEETAHHKKKERPELVGIAMVPLQKSPTVVYGPETGRPALDLGHIPRIKRRLDIKAPSHDSGSSSSSDSENETTNHIRKQEKGEIHMARLPVEIPRTVSHDPQMQRPVLDTSIKRSLDTKAPSATSESSSSSDSEDEKAHSKKKERPGLVGIAMVPFQKSPPIIHGQETGRPALDLGHIPSIKSRLDIKAPSHDSGSSSSSDSENETTNHVRKQEKGEIHMARLPIEVPRTVSHDPQMQRPVLNTSINSSLDIKAPSAASESSSSSASEDETAHHKKERPELVGIAIVPFQKSPTVIHGQEMGSLSLDLGHIPRVKRRLDIKAPLHDSDSSSSSDSEYETTNHIRTQEKGEIHMARLPIEVSRTVSHDPQTQRPVLDTRIKSDPDIKSPSAASESSSSSDSEDERAPHKKKERPGLVGIAMVPFQKSPTVIRGQEMGSLALDLGHIPRVKRRLDIKAPLHDSDSSSSSDSEYETTNHIRTQEKGEIHIAELPIEVSRTVSHDPQTQRPVLDTRIKSDPNIKSSSAASESSSSSDSEDERAHHTKKERPELVAVAGVLFKTSPTVTHGPETRLPALDLEHIPRVKRHLDIKAPLQEVYSSSSNSDNESRISSRTVKHEKGKDNVGIKNDGQQTKLHKLSLGVPSIKRRLDIKAPSPQRDQILSSVSPGFQQSESNSSSSISEDENRDDTMVGLGASAISKAKKKKFIRSPKTPVIHTSLSPKIEHNIKLEKYTTSTGDMEDKTTNESINTTPDINQEFKSRWAKMSLSVSRFRKRLEITQHTHEPPNLPSSPPPDSPSSSSSEKWTGGKSSRTGQNRRGAGMQGIRHTESSPTPENKLVDVSSPDTMLTDFGTPYFGGHYNIKVSEKAPATVQELSDSSSNSESEDASTEHAGKRWWGRSQLPVVTEKEASQINSSLYVAPAVKSQTSKMGEELDSVQSHLSLTNIPHIMGDLGIRAPIQRETYSGSNSKNETIGHHGSSNTSSSCSENENEETGYTEKQSRHAPDIPGKTDNDSVITYKRLIFKAPSPEEPSHRVGGSNASSGPRTVPSLSFDDVVRKRIEQSTRTTYVDLPPEIRWTGLHLPLSDHATSSQRRDLDAGLLSPQQAPAAEPNSSSSESDDEIKQNRGKAVGTPMHIYSPISTTGASLASSRALDEFDNSVGMNENLRAIPEDRRERKGLSALKAMSSERRKWDTQAGNVDMGTYPLFDDHHSKVDTSLIYHRSEVDIKPISQQPLTQFHTSSTTVDERATDLLYDFPQYRRHDIGGIKRPQEAPPPIPAKPPPDEALGLKWRAPQSNVNQGLDATRSYQQQSRNTEKSDPSSTASQNQAVYSDSSNPNISFV